MLLTARLNHSVRGLGVLASWGISNVPYLLGGLILAWQVACGIHVVRTGRQLYWLWIIIIAPFLGSLIYTLVEMGPEIMRSRHAAVAGEKARDIIDPDRRLRALMDNLDTADSAQNKHAVAEEYLRRNEPQKALPLLQSAATGLYSDDPMILMTLADAQFALRPIPGDNGHARPSQGEESEIRECRRPSALCPQPGGPGSQR